MQAKAENPAPYPSIGPATGLRSAACSGPPILAWDYPAGEGINDLVAKFRLHPVMCLYARYKAMDFVDRNLGILRMPFG